MAENTETPEQEEIVDTAKKQSEVVYKTEKDFYKGMSGELRYKAEGLFKKAKEKGISIEDISIDMLRSNSAEFPGIGPVDLPAYLVKVRGKELQSGQIITDGKQIDYYNRYQTYLAEKIHTRNVMRDERGRIVRENGRPRLKGEPEMLISDWERFEIGKSLVEDKEFGLEKTITGACDRVIRKLMGENDWLAPEEARMLDEEFSSVQKAILREREAKGCEKGKQAEQTVQTAQVVQKKATERQINYLKARIRNAGLDPESEKVEKEILRQARLTDNSLRDITSSNISKVIDTFNEMVPRIREVLGADDGEIRH